MDSLKEQQMQQHSEALEQPNTETMKESSNASKKPGRTGLPRLVSHGARPPLSPTSAVTADERSHPTTQQLNNPSTVNHAETKTTNFPAAEAAVPPAAGQFRHDEVLKLISGEPELDSDVDLVSDDSGTSSEADTRPKETAKSSTHHTEEELNLERSKLLSQPELSTTGRENLCVDNLITKTAHQLVANIRTVGQSENNNQDHLHINGNLRRTDASQRLKQPNDSKPSSDDAYVREIQENKSRKKGFARRCCFTCFSVLIVIVGVLLAVSSSSVVTQFFEKNAAADSNLGTFYSLGNFVPVRQAVDGVSNWLERLINSTKLQASCPTSFTYNSAVNGCYVVVNENKEWHDADFSCKRLHSSAHIVYINSHDEQLQIEQLLDTHAGQECIDHHSKQPGKSIWIGGQRINPLYKSTVVWKTFTSTESNGGEKVEEIAYSNWQLGEPDYSYWPGPSPEACISLHGASKGQWADEQCILKYCFICEFDLH